MDAVFAVKFLGALFAIMNPFINLPVFLSLTSDNTVQQQRAMAAKILLYSTVMCVVIAVAGTKIIGFFGVSIDAFRVAGGLVLLGIAFAMLNGKPIATNQGDRDGLDPDAIAFYPMTFPMIVGPGTIATLVIYSAQVHGSEQMLGFASVLAAVLLCVYVVLFFASAFGKLLSARMRVIVTRLMGMVLAAIAVEMVFAGTKVLLPGLG